MQQIVARRDERLILRGARVADGRGVRHERADLLIDAGRIVAIDPAGIPLGADRTAGAKVVELGGLTLVPGLMNAHAHITLDGSPDPGATLAAETPSETAIRAARRLREVVESGVTTIRDVGDVGGIDIALRAMVERDEIVGPRMLTAGKVITMTGGHGHWMGVECDGPDEVRKGVRGQIKAGATAIKLMATGDMGFTQAKKYDLEVWAPGVQDWLEVSSVSNFRDFQARRMNIRWRPEPGARPEILHTLNGSGLALARVVAADRKSTRLNSSHT